MKTAFARILLIVKNVLVKILLILVVTLALSPIMPTSAAADDLSSTAPAWLETPGTEQATRLRTRNTVLFARSHVAMFIDESGRLYCGVTGELLLENVIEVQGMLWEDDDWLGNRLVYIFALKADGTLWQLNDKERIVQILEDIRTITRCANYAVTYCGMVYQLPNRSTRHLRNLGLQNIEFVYSFFDNTRRSGGIRYRAVASNGELYEWTARHNPRPVLVGLHSWQSSPYPRTHAQPQRTWRYTYVVYFPYFWPSDSTEAYVIQRTLTNDGRPGSGPYSLNSNGHLYFSTELIATDVFILKQQPHRGLFLTFITNDGAYWRTDGRHTQVILSDVMLPEVVIYRVVSDGSYSTLWLRMASRYWGLEDLEFWLVTIGVILLFISVLVIACIYVYTYKKRTGSNYKALLGVGGGAYALLIVVAGIIIFRSPHGFVLLVNPIFAGIVLLLTVVNLILLVNKTRHVGFSVACVFAQLVVAIACVVALAAIAGVVVAIAYVIAGIIAVIVLVGIVSSRGGHIIVVPRDK